MRTGDAKFIEVDAGVRYWEDASLNSQEDAEGKIALRVGERWKPVVELATGRVLRWPEGVEADIHYKVCDDGEYWLLDKSGSRIAKWRGDYVPDDFLCVGSSGYGDYIIFKIGGDGLIVGWRNPDVDPDEWKSIENSAAPTVKASQSDTHPSATARNEED